ncbi:MAG: low molecular weight protein arginine phosphatase [Candidatus Omnitrophota bacterium]|nr:low molecular weight protein arginine phosphatase [Candidatus Omnitrophota bacterium]
MKNIKSVLLVCTGNSCRSIMADGLLKKYLKELGKSDIEVISAGVHAIDGMAPTKETIEVMKKEGIDVSGFRSRSLTEDHIKKADLILVMAGHHMDDIITRVPHAASKVHILKQFGLKHDQKACEDIDIADPIGRDRGFYEEVLLTIKEEMSRVAKIL